MLKPHSPTDAEPSAIHDGLAMYSIGEGEPLLLMPYPHGYGIVPIAIGPLAQALKDLERRIISFDPPGVLRSTRAARVTMPEMLGCTAETLRALEITQPIDLVGHSMGGLCAIAFALAHPDWVKRLVIIGSLSGGPAIRRGRGMPWGNWLKGLDRWRFVYLGTRLGLGIGNLAVHKRLLRLLWKASYADKSLVPTVEIAKEDKRHPAPLRDRWTRVALRLDYSQQLCQIRLPALICVGRFDPQAPVACSEELAHGIPGASLVIFEQSGHYPFIEEQQPFASVVAGFLAEH